MKTVRQIYIERHSAAEKELDRLREQTVAKYKQEAQSRGREAVLGVGRKTSVAKADAGPGFLKRWLDILWLDVVRPARRTWVGFAAVWAAVVVANVMDANSSLAVEAKTSPISEQSLVAWFEQKRMVNEIFAAETRMAVTVDRPRPSVPKPRSHNQSESRCC